MKFIIDMDDKNVTIDSLIELYNAIDKINERFRYAKMSEYLGILRSQIQITADYIIKVKDMLSKSDFSIDEYKELATCLAQLVDGIQFTSTYITYDPFPLEEFLNIGVGDYIYTRSKEYNLYARISTSIFVDYLLRETDLDNFSKDSEEEEDF